jgi:pentatricopeptide repeat protein
VHELTQTRTSGGSNETARHNQPTSTPALETVSESSRAQESTWQSILAALELDLKAGATVLRACVNRNLGDSIEVAESRASLVEWRKILDRSRQAVHDLRLERKSMVLSDRAVPIRLMQVYASLRVGDTTKALGLLSRLLADTSATMITRHLSPHLPPLLGRLSETEDCSSVLAVLTPLFANRRKLDRIPLADLRDSVVHLVTAIGDPIAWLQRQLLQFRRLPSGSKRQNLERGSAELMLFGIIDNASPRTLCNLYDEIHANGIIISPLSAANAASKLASRGFYDKAHEICSTIDLTVSFDVNTANAVLRMLHDLGLGDDAARILASQAVDVDVDLLLDTLRHCVKHLQQTTVLAIISRNVPRVAAAIAGRRLGEMLQERDEQVLKRLLTTYTSIGDVAQGEVLLRILETGGVPLGISPYHSLLQAYATRRDAPSALRILTKMRARSLDLDRATYSTLMSLYVNQKNPGAVQSTFDQMQQHGIAPDSISYAILLNAHIEVGNWAEAASIWRSLPKDMQSEPNIANTLLKGMVLISMPYQEVYRLFLSVYTDPSKADQIAWTILIQSACDSGNLSRARELYHDFKLLARQNGSALHLDHYISSILVVGHIRYGDIVTATHIHDEMQREGIENTSVIYAAIIDASLRGRWPMPAHRAKELAHKLLNESDALQREPHKGRAQPVENIIVPLMQSAIRDHDIQESERLFELAVQKEGQPSLGLYTMLLDAYRHAKEYDRVQEVWKALRALVVAQKAPATKTLGTDRRLCIPLSIYMDAMLSANRLPQIQRVWADVHKQGFGFDPHNWNQFAIALVRAGDVLRGFDIVENVLIKRQEEVESRQFLGIRPADSRWETMSEESIAANSEPTSSKDLLLDPTNRPPNRRHEFRNDSAAYLALRQERHADVESTAQPGSLDFDPNILSRFRPTDALWRPYYYTVAVLEWSYSQMEQGRSAMLALVAAEEEEGDREATSASDHEGSNPSAQQSSPAALLAKINSKYAKTVSLIMLHRRKRRDRDLVRKRTVTKSDT